MKLNLIFIIMDFLTMLMFPVAFVYGKLCQFSKVKESINPANLLVIDPTIDGRT